MTWSTCHRKTHCWEQDAFAKAIMNRICGQKAVAVNSDEGWNLIRPSLIHLFCWLAENCKGRFPNDVGAAHQAVSGAIKAQKKNAYNCRSTGASLDALKYGQKRCIAWIEGHGLFYYLWGKALITTWWIRGVCYDSMGRNNTVIRAGKK